MSDTGPMVLWFLVLRSLLAVPIIAIWKPCISAFSQYPFQLGILKILQAILFLLQQVKCQFCVDMPFWPISYVSFWSFSPFNCFCFLKAFIHLSYGKIYLYKWEKWCLKNFYVPTRCDTVKFVSLRSTPQKYTSALKIWLDDWYVE